MKLSVKFLRTALLLYALLSFFLIIASGLVHFGFVHETGASVMVKQMMTGAFLFSLAACGFAVVMRILPR